MSSRVDKSLRLNLENIDVVDFLHELGLRNIEDKGDEVYFSCPFPGHKSEDVHASASMRAGDTVTYCFACGWSGNALKFLADYEGVSPLVAARWIRQRFGDDFLEPQGSFLEEIDTILAGTKKREDIVNGVLDDIEAFRRRVDWHEVGKVWEFGTPEMVATVPMPFLYMLDRGFMPRILEEYEIGWDAISQRITIPYRGQKGQLLGFKGRAYLDGQIPRYWMLGGSEYGFEPFNVSQTIWGLHTALVCDDPVIVVEGELNALMMRQCGYDNAVGISGKFLSNTQVKLLIKYFNEAVIVMDEFDDAYMAAEKLEAHMKVSIVPDHDSDPAEMTAHEVKMLLEDAESLQLIRLMDV